MQSRNRDNSGNPFFVLGKALVKKIATDSPTLAAGKALARDCPNYCTKKPHH